MKNHGTPSCSWTPGQVAEVMGFFGPAIAAEISRRDPAAVIAALRNRRGLLAGKLEEVLDFFAITLEDVPDPRTSTRVSFPGERVYVISRLECSPNEAFVTRDEMVKVIARRQGAYPFLGKRDGRYILENQTCLPTHLEGVRILFPDWVDEDTGEMYYINYCPALDLRDRGWAPYRLSHGPLGKDPMDLKAWALIRQVA